MKKILFFIFALFLYANAKAQDNPSYVSAMTFFQYETESKALDLKLSLEYGKFLGEKTSVGMTLKYILQKDVQNVVMFEPYYRKYFVKGERVGIFGDGVVGVNLTFPKDGDAACGFKVGFGPGFDVQLTDKLYFIGKLGFIGYNQPGAFDSKKYVRVAFLSLSKDDLDMMSFGIRYTF
ncbi:MAG: hypothetical protein IKP73_08440 [Bacteroidales bacterium]|nr:hypothetical protein [Bacteroidales bacterium]